MTNETIATPDVDYETDHDDPTDEEDLELHAIDLYQPADLETDIDPDHRDVHEDADHDLPHGCDTPPATSSTTVADVPMSIIHSEIIAGQKSDDFCQTISAKMDGPR